eukprot:m.16946 g.16946  ORF g.16946 m.16946 type:complete len:435 (-) comp5848_c0_seq1:27-1331(-)
MAVFGGDEVGAIVLDVGSSLTKAGFAGEDTPRSVFPSLVGYVPENDSTAESGQMDTAPDKTNGTGKNGRKCSVGTNRLKYPKPGLELFSPVRDGLVEDWDMYEELLDYVYKDQLRADPEEHPLMVAEATWNTKLKREQFIELMFEKYKVPALFLAKSAVLSAFASGRSTALIIDGGASSTSVTPVYDGFVLYNGLRRSSIGGDILSEQFLKALEATTEVVPQFEVKSKTAVGESELPIYERKKIPGLTQSFLKFSKLEIIRDLESCIGRVAHPTYQEEALANLPTSIYEFPNGFHRPFGVERYSVPEILFDPSKFGQEEQSGIKTADLKPIHKLVVESIQSCDIDIHNNMWSSIILSGGTTQYPGYTERLSHELHVAAMNTKCKVLSHASGIDRVFSPWVGGSIQGSLGSFQQMWVSRIEFEEAGKGIVHKKCA